MVGGDSITVTQTQGRYASANVGTGLVVNATLGSSGFAAGTGSAFSLLPAQNATGNWIKVVQRVPVRITLDSKELQQHPLRLGLSMEVKVDTSKQDGPVLTAASRNPALSTTVFDGQLAQADHVVARIIAANLGK